MDILLVNASIKSTSKHASLNPPLGLAYIASVLLRAGYSVSVIDFNISGYKPRLLEVALNKDKPRILGISAHTETYPNGLEIARMAKQILPEITVITGGTHPTVMYKEVAAEKDVDVVVRGEGEYTMLELVDYFIKGRGTLSNIAGIAYRENGEVKTTPERAFIENPDELPFPARYLFPMPLYETPGQVLMSRGGCPFNCHFCAVNNIWKGRRRFRSPEKVVEEIAQIFENFQTDEISFADDAFTLNRELVVKLCELSKDLKKSFLWRWKCATRVDLVDKELLEILYQAGCYSITFGIEAGSQRILDSIGKGITLNQVRQAVSLAISAGIGVSCAFMFPHPDDTEETIHEQKSFMAELAKMGATINLAATTPFPGTYYYDHADELGIKILAKGWDEYDCKHLVITTKNLSEERLHELLQELVQDVGLQISD
jgi:radical SAM superfamily enzyme YgiQ (UPF0313 family)